MSDQTATPEAPATSIDELLRFAAERRRAAARLRSAHTLLGEEILELERLAGVAEGQAAERQAAAELRRAQDRRASEAHPYTPPRVDATTGDSGCGEGRA